MALRAARGSEALLGVALDNTSDTFNVGQPALTVAGDNYGFRFLRPDSFNLGATYETIEPSELTGTAFRGANTPGALNVGGTITGSIRTGSAVPVCYSMFGTAAKSELSAGYAYQYIWTTAGKSSPRSLTAQVHKGGSLTPETFYGLFGDQWTMSVEGDQPGTDSVTLTGHHHTTSGIGYQVKGTGTFAGVLCAYGIRADSAALADGLWVKVTTGPSTGTFGVKMKVGNATTYDGTEVTCYYNTTSKYQAQGGGQFTDRFVALDESDASIGLDTCSSKSDVTLLFTGGDITGLAQNDEFFVNWKALIPGSYTPTNLISNGTFTGGATSWTVGTGWAYGTNNVAHTPGNTAALEQNFTAVSGALYKVTFTIVSRSAGNVTPYIGAVAGTAVTAAATYTQYIVAAASGSVALKFTPDTNSDAVIDTIVLEKLTGTSAVEYTGDAVDYITGCKLTGAHLTVKKDSTAFEVMSAEIAITTPHERIKSLGAGPAGSDIEGTGFWGLEATLVLRHKDRTFERLLQTDDKVTFGLEFVGPLLLDGGSVSTGYRNTLKFEANQAAVISSSAPIANENVVMETVVIRVETPDAGTEALTVTAITAESY
jgi:hypothetical protein